MDVKLIVVSAKTGTKEISVRRPRILGRARGIGIVLPHPTVSLRHCLLFEHSGVLMVQDLNSATGTFVGGRRIVLAPLPPGAEFTVGPLTFRAEYVYSGSQDLPKTIFDEPENETPVESHQETAAPTEPSPPTPTANSFFGFEGNGHFPSVAPTAPMPEAARTPAKVAPAIPVQKPQPPLPPPLPKAIETPRSDFGEFFGESETGGEEFFPQFAASEEIPGLNVDADIPSPAPQEPDPEPSVKKTGSGSLLDYFSKRPHPRKRIAPLAPETIGPLEETEPVSEVPSPRESSEANQSPPESVDDDLSNFFKKLE